MKDIIYNYADDNTIAIIDNDIETVKEVLSVKTSYCTTWFSDNMLKANPSKFQLMLLDKSGKLDCSHEIVIGDVCLKNMKSVKLLGVTIDCNLNYTQHVNELCKKASRNINITARLSRFMPGKDERLAIINAFVNSMFSYCPLIWQFCNVTSIRKIEKIYERSLRFITKNYSSSYEELLTELDCSTLLLCRLKCLATFMYKCKKGLVPNYVNMYQETNDLYNFRNNVRFNLCRYKTKQFGYKSLLYAGVKLWNSMPIKLKTAENIDLFKHGMIQWKCLDPRCEKCLSYVYHGKCKI